MPAEVVVAESDEDILRCLPVMASLRPGFEPDAFLRQVRRQQKQGYFLAFLHDSGVIKSVAGFRFMEMLGAGRILYVDDLATEPSERSRGNGRALLAWLVNIAKERGCDVLQLDSGVQRKDAHRFYFRERMHIRSYKFSIDLAR
jgi:GNAT superfamily N-acetyltransferase